MVKSNVVLQALIDNTKITFSLSNNWTSDPFPYSLSPIPSSHHFLLLPSESRTTFKLSELSLLLSTGFHYNW
jgi:hypothetical protein